VKKANKIKFKLIKMASLQICFKEMSKNKEMNKEVTNNKMIKYQKKMIQMKTFHNKNLKNRNRK